MKLMKNILGVTLLEIMLVLAIAAMIIVLSVRYYQSATSSSQANTALAEVEAIIAAANSIAQTSGSLSSVTSSALAALLPATGLVMPWGETVTVTGASSSTLTIAFASIPSGVCPLLDARLKSNNYITGNTACTGGTTAITYTYNAQTG